MDSGLDEVSIFICSFSKKIGGGKLQENLWEVNFYKNKTYNIRVMEFLVLGFFWAIEFFLIFKDFLVNFYCNTSLNKFPIELSIDKSCSIHLFHKDRLKGFTVARNHFSPL